MADAGIRLVATAAWAPGTDMAIVLLSDRHPIRTWPLTKPRREPWHLADVSAVIHEATDVGQFVATALGRPFTIDHTSLDILAAHLFPAPKESTS